MMAKTDRRQDDQDANPFDERGVLKDHRSHRVPMYAVDALSRDAAQYFARVTDATGDGGLSLHKPGFRISSSITRDRSIYDAYDAAAEVAYKNLGAREREALGQRVDRQEDAASVTDDRSAAYQEFEDRIQNAWRNP